MSTLDSRNYHHGQLRDALIALAVEAVESDDDKGLSLRELARRAGVSAAAPYRHFKDRDELLAAVAAYGYGELTRRLLKARSVAVEATTKPTRGSNSDDSGNPGSDGADGGGRSEPELRAALTRLAVAYVRFALENAALFGLMFGQRCSRSDEVKTASMQAMRVFSDLVTGSPDSSPDEMAGIQPAPSMRANVPVEATQGNGSTQVIAGWSLVHGLATLLADGKVQAPDGIDSLVSAVVDATVSRGFGVAGTV